MRERERQDRDRETETERDREREREREREQWLRQTAVKDIDKRYGRNSTLCIK